MYLTYFVLLIWKCHQKNWKSTEKDRYLLQRNDGVRRKSVVDASILYGLCLRRCRISCQFESSSVSFERVLWLLISCCALCALRSSFPQATRRFSWFLQRSLLIFVFFTLDKFWVCSRVATRRVGPSILCPWKWKIVRIV